MVSRKILSVIVCVFVLLPVLAFASGQPATGTAEEQVIEITYAFTARAGGEGDQRAQRFKAWAEEESNGRLVVNLYPGSQLGSAPEIAEGAQVGSIQIGAGSSGQIAGFIPEVQVMDIPFLLPGDVDLVTKLLNKTKVTDVLAKKFDGAGLTLLAIQVAGMKQYSANKPIRQPDDFKGLKFRTMQSPMLVKSFEVLGASPTPIPYAELYSSLQLGIVEGQENPFQGIYDSKLYEVQDYLIVSNHAPFVRCVYASKKWYDALPSDLQDIVMTGVREIATIQGNDIIRDVDKDRFAKLQATDMEIIELTAAQRNAFREATTPLRDEFIKLVGESGKEILEVVEEEMQKLQ
jgi:tripartite ATP-independent transporter DctP family solute receptor